MFGLLKAPEDIDVVLDGLGDGRALKHRFARNLEAGQLVSVCGYVLQQRRTLSASNPSLELSSTPDCTPTGL